MRCMVMRLDERESLAYIKGQGFDLSRARFYRIKKRYMIQDLKGYPK